MNKKLFITTLSILIPDRSKASTSSDLERKDRGWVGGAFSY